MSTALLTAGGAGTRMHRDIPKQFLHVKNRPILTYILGAFERHPSIDAIIVVGLGRWTDTIWAYAKQLSVTKLKWVVSDENTGHESICNGLLELEKHCDISDVATIHGGNRPIISPGIISNSSTKQKEFGSAVAVTPCVEMIFRSKNGQPSTINIPRDELLHAQTPHTYELRKLLWARRESGRLSISNTVVSYDLMCGLGETVHFSKGLERDLKMTAVGDMEVLTSLLDHREEEGLK